MKVVFAFHNVKEIGQSHAHYILTNIRYKKKIIPCFVIDKHNNEKNYTIANMYSQEIVNDFIPSIY